MKEKYFEHPDELYLFHTLLVLHCVSLRGDRDLERLHEPDREEEYEYLLRLDGEQDTGEDDRDDERDEERDEELELL